MNMRLIGARNVKEITRGMVDASNIGSHVVSVPRDRLYDSNCQSSAVCFVLGVPSDMFLQWIDESMQHAQLRDVKAKL